MEVTTNEIWTKLFVAPAISLAVDFLNKRKEKRFSQKFKVFSFFFQNFHLLPKLNNDLRNFLEKKSLFERTRLKNQKKKDDTKELEKKGLKKGMNNVRKKRNKHNQKKHQREQINIRRVIEHEKRKHEETKKGEKVLRKKRE